MARNSPQKDGGEKLNFDRRNFGETRKSVETTTDEATHTRSLNSLSLSPTISLDWLVSFSLDSDFRNSYECDCLFLSFDLLHSGGGVVYKGLRKY